MGAGLAENRKPKTRSESRPASGRRPVHHRTSFSKWDPVTQKRWRSGWASHPEGQRRSERLHASDEGGVQKVDGDRPEARCQPGPYALDMRAEVKTADRQNEVDELPEQDREGVG
jgi:hypothetical protein